MIKAVSSVALVVVIVCLLALAVGGSLFEASPILVAVQLFAAALAVWARRSFPGGAFRVTAIPEGVTVIQKGPYRLIRHPMYSAALLLLWSGIATHLRPWTIGIGLVATSVVLARIVVEERLLREKYPGYGDYARATRAVVPFVL